MKKKIITILLTLFLFTSASFAKDSTQVHGSWALGLQAGYVVNGLGGFSVTFKVPKVPLLFAADFGFSSHHFTIGATGDYWLMNPQIVGPLYWYFGPGGAVSVKGGDDFGLFVGPRFVIGLDVFPVKPLEIYLQLAAQIGFGMDNDSACLGWGFPLNLGIRWWFK